MIEIVGLIGEAEARRIEHPHLGKGWPGLSAVLQMRNVGRVCHLVEALGDILAHGAERRGNNKEQKDDDANADMALAETAPSRSCAGALKCFGSSIGRICTAPVKQILCEHCRGSIAG